MALLAYEDSLCGGCGQPKDVVYNPDAEGWFEAHTVTCAGCAAQQEHSNKQRSQKTTPTPGEKVFVVDGRPAELELKPWSLLSGGAGDDEGTASQP